ncbi:StbB family protein [Undibacterium sp. SXout7W]|uniref:StbB family protein n=1 Tax=Undibacterium sp. SXout7W TaxID=3413049 RepID=UPI003BF37395
MKIVVTSFCGDVGKTTLTANFLLPRLKPEIPSDCIFSFETLNGGLQEAGVKAHTVPADKFDEVLDAVMLSKAALVDVGQSNAEKFFEKMVQLDGSHEEFDCFLIPVVESSHAIEEAVRTVEALHVMGVPAKKIKIVFNKIDGINFDIESKFAEIVALHQLKKATVNTKAAIYKSPLFDELKDTQLTLADVINDPINYRADFNSVMGTDKQAYYLVRIAMKRRSSQVTQNLDNVYAELRL